MFAFDLSLPLGVAGGVPYVALVLCGAWFTGERPIIALAAASTILVLIGVVLSPPGGIAWVVATNRALALFAIWITAFLLILRKRSEEEIQNAHDELELRVKERTRELQQSEEKYQDLYDNAPDMFSSADPATSNVIDCNETFARNLGYRKDEIIGQSIWFVCPPESVQNLGKAFKSFVETGEVHDAELQLMRKDGTRIDVSLNVSAIRDEQGKILRSRSIWRDITEHKQLEVQLAGAQKMEALGKMTGGVAHEFNNLLMAVTGNLQLLQDRLKGQEDLTRLASNSLKAAFRGAELTHQLLSYTGQQVLMPKVTDISAFTSEIVDLLRSVLGEGVELETTLADDSWPVAVDQGQFQQAMLNLSINARDAMPAGGKLTIETANVHLDAAYAATRSFKVNLGDYVRVSVTDTGTGMPPEVLEKVFDPFFTTKGMAEGTGLGLSMVYGFIKRQSGGHIDIDSAVGRGTTVHLYLPRAEVVEEEPAGVGDQPDKRIEGRGTVLVVEDDPRVRELICDDVLAGLGYTAYCAEDGPAALAHLERSGPVDLLLADVLLPKDMNGAELARRVQESTPATKVILMTGYSVDTLEGRGLSVSGYLLLHKPFPVAELTRVIAEALNGRDD